MSNLFLASASFGVRDGSEAFRCWKTNADKLLQVLGHPVDFQTDILLILTPPRSSFHMLLDP
jgi:hypothetical protein